MFSHFSGSWVGPLAPCFLCMQGVTIGPGPMDNNIEVIEYGWTDNSDTKYSRDMSTEEMEFDLLSSNDEIPIARHRPNIRPD